MILGYIIFFSLLGSIGSVLISALFLIFPDKIQKGLIPKCISFATGTLLGAAFLGLMPHAAEKFGDLRLTLFMVLVGLIIFFILEKFVIWRHCHDDHCHVHEASGSLIMIGDAFHNFVDGVVIAATFTTSIPLGITTAFSVITHEIPQEVGDFAILLKNNYTKKRAFMLNVFSGLSSLAGAILAYFFMSTITNVTPYIMSISAASFIYVAISDLIPHLQEHTNPKESITQTFLILAGISVIYFMSHTH